MGGYGSTRWAWHRKKSTVDDSRTLSVFDLKREGILEPDIRCYGGWEWRNARTSEKTASISYELNTLEMRPYLRVSYAITRWNGQKQDYDYRIPLQTTACRFGGLRWWFVCPLSVNGRYCGRRVAKLYLPPGGGYFGCRHCHDLTYRSSQESDKRISALRKLGSLAILRGMQEGNIDLIAGLKALPDDIWRC